MSARIYTVSILRILDLIIFREIAEAGDCRVAFEAGRVGFGGKDSRLHAELPTPLRGALRLPRPVVPAPRLLEAVHLRLGEHLEELLVRSAVLVGSRVGRVTRTGRR